MGIRDEVYIASGGTNDDKQNPPNQFLDPAQLGQARIEALATPTTTAGQPGPTSNSVPGKRLQNPLGNFSSYTYQLSLYMITPTAYNDFILSGRKDITPFQTPDNTGKGVFLVAQSGGINNSTSKRAPGFELDYYIDNLKIKTLISPSENQTSTNELITTFDIIEPYGFSFISNLKRALDALTAGATASASPTSSASSVSSAAGQNARDDLLARQGTPVTGQNARDDLLARQGTPAPTTGSNTTPSNASGSTNPTRQFYILGIRFQGYDKDGNLISSKDEIGYNGDPSGNANGVYQRFFDISITDIKFKLDGKAVVYHCTAVNSAVREACYVKNGILDNGATIIGSTIDDAFMGNTDGKLGLFTKLNNDQIKLFNDKAILIPNRYKITYLGGTDQTIGQASIVSLADLDKLKWKMNNANNTKDSNLATEKSTNPVPDQRQVQIMRGTPILQAIQQVITQSSFLEKALTTVYKSNEEPSKEDILLNPDKYTVSWYNVTPEIKILGWDAKQSDFAYEFNYVFQPYSTPIITSAYAKNTPPYPGPFKRYEYWFTGKNSEVISYQQTMDQLYMNVAVKPSENDQSHGGDWDVPTAANKQQEQPKQGALNSGKEAQNSVLTSLLDTGAYLKAKVKILGDPDWLTNASVSSIQEVYDRFYGPDGYTINPNGGQSFIEINFKEPKDYKNSIGLMSINDSISFNNSTYPDYVQKQIDKRGGGIIYHVMHVDSTFHGGKFEQELDLKGATSFAEANAMTDTGRPDQSAAETNRLNNANTPLANAPNQSAAETNRLKAQNYLLANASTGFTQNTTYSDPMGTSDGAAIMNAATATQNQTKTVPTKTGRVQDDDGGVNYNYF